ncbi:unnamed protein product [Meloidogyne enterolobii]|uniref:Uncharacterized protein n=1 Tax=Meloidogyne enterolobii TaxID=390850 RepID=A0ACB0XVE1_MELEN
MEKNFFVISRKISISITEIFVLDLVPVSIKIVFKPLLYYFFISPHFYTKFFRPNNLIKFLTNCNFLFKEKDRKWGRYRCSTTNYSL